jgi:hypothetical protein
MYKEKINSSTLIVDYVLDGQVATKPTMIWILKTLDL